MSSGVLYRALFRARKRIVCARAELSDAEADSTVMFLSVGALLFNLGDQAWYNPTWCVWLRASTNFHRKASPGYLPMAFCRIADLRVTLCLYPESEETNGTDRPRSYSMPIRGEFPCDRTAKRL